MFLYLALELIVQIVRNTDKFKPYLRLSETNLSTVLLLAQPTIRCFDTVHLNLIVSRLKQKQSRIRSSV